METRNFYILVASICIGMTAFWLSLYNFTLYDPEARTVYVVGDFNGWNAYSHPLKKDSKGKWKLTLSLTPGRYEYLFLVDDQWKSDPRCTNLTPNIFGGENCVLKIT